MGLFLALAGFVVFIASLVLATLWLIPSFRHRHPSLGRSALWGLLIGFLLFLSGGFLLKENEPAPPEESSPSPPNIRVPPE
jgi:hypothetical protein